MHGAVQRSCPLFILGPDTAAAGIRSRMRADRTRGTTPGLTYFHLPAHFGPAAFLAPQVRGFTAIRRLYAQV